MVKQFFNMLYVNSKVVMRFVKSNHSQFKVSFLKETAFYDLFPKLYSFLLIMKPSGDLLVSIFKHESLWSLRQWVCGAEQKMK